MGADNPAWVLPEAGAVRALPVAITLTDHARGWKNDTDLGNRLTDPAFGLLGRDAVLTVIGLQNAGLGPTRPVGIVQASEVPGTGVMAWPVAGYGVVAAGGLRGEEDEQA